MRGLWCGATRGGMLMGRGCWGKVVTGLLLVMLLINLTDGNEEGEGEKLPRPNVVRGEVFTCICFIKLLQAHTDLV